MSKELATELFESLGFEEIQIEEGLMALCHEVEPDGRYLLVTDEDGNWPEDLTLPVVLALYSAKNVFQGSATVKNSKLFKERWLASQTMEARLESFGLL